MDREANLKIAEVPTEEDYACIKKEAQIWHDTLVERFKKMETLTAEDWLTVIC